MLVRLGREGYRRVQQESRDTAMWLATEIGGMDAFEPISDGAGIPAFAFRIADGVEGFDVYDLSEALRVYGWIVPAYRMPPNLEDLAVLRIVVRNGFSPDLAQLLLRDLGRAVHRLAGGAPPPEAKRTAFHH
jgi:glutamate decarboxylase